MNQRWVTRILAIPSILWIAASLWNASCNGSGTSGDFTENLDITACDPTEGPFTLEIDNPYFPLEAGTQWVLEGDDGGTAVRLVITVLAETEEVAGVTTRVLEEREAQRGGRHGKMRPGGSQGAKNGFWREVRL